MNLIIGHTTSSGVAVWVRGDWLHRTAIVTVCARNDGLAQDKSRELPLSHSYDYTGVAWFGDGLDSDTEYSVTAKFPGGLLGFDREAKGCFKTFPEAGDETTFSFVMGSCNLPVIAINNFLGKIAGELGMMVATRSFLLEGGLWKTIVRAPWRALGAAFVYLTSRLVALLTKFRQPPPPLIRSPFPALGFREIEFENMHGEPMQSEILVVLDKHGDECASACLLKAPEFDEVILEPGKAGRDVAAEDKDDKNRRVGTSRGAIRSGRMFLHHLTGEFKAGHELSIKNRKEDKATIKSVGRPAFMIHAGDQIYFDVPNPLQMPSVRKYRRKYREAWMQDEHAVRLLASGPQYMTLDDHEIVDQYAQDYIQDFGLKLSPRDYFEPAIRAYDEYVHSRQPTPPASPETGRTTGADETSDNDDTPDSRERTGAPPRPDKGRYYYDFSHGACHFFVLDTRTERHKGAGQMISRAQLEAIKDWIDLHPQGLMFLVSTIPFLAEVRQGTVKEPGSDAEDKWSGSVFRDQRDELIRYIYDHEVTKLVVLCGDMHCCYHATMQIGPVNDRLTLHELAAGPIYQALLGREQSFHRQFRGKIPSRSYDPSRQPREERSARDIRYMTRMQQLHGNASAAMLIQVSEKQSDWYRALAGDDWTRKESTAYHVDWTVVRTIARRPAAMSGRIALFDKGDVRDFDDGMSPHDTAASG